MTISSIVDKESFGVALDSKRLKFESAYLTDRGELDLYCEPPPAEICFISPKKEVLVPQVPNLDQNLYIGKRSARSECTFVLKKVQDELKFVNLDQTILDETAVYIKIPVGANLKTNDVTTLSHLYVGKESLSTLPPFKNSKVYFSTLGREEGRVSMTESKTLIGRDCVDSCFGRKCNAFDDCGNRCGCPVGMECNIKTGECELAERHVEVLDRRWRLNSVAPWIVGVLLIILMILFIILIIYLIRRQK